MKTSFLESCVNLANWPRVIFFLPCNTADSLNAAREIFDKNNVSKSVLVRSAFLHNTEHLRLHHFCITLNTRNTTIK